jgi:hypothetical protein
MLYLIYKGNDPQLNYRGGQDSIIHLEADLRRTVAWAERHNHRWAFTLSNAGARYFEDRCDLSRLREIDWTAIEAKNWRRCKEAKQAEFLLERRFPWELIMRIGVSSNHKYSEVQDILSESEHKPPVEVKPDWYYP